jgi:hypothetical protein
METCAQRTHYDTEVVPAPERLKLLSYTAYGICIGLQISFDLLPYLPSPLIPGAKLDAMELPLTNFGFQRVRSANGDAAFQVSGDVSGVFLSGNVEAAARELESRIHHYVARSTEAAMFVHAGVVAWRGRAIVIPGASHSGKSTLVAELVSKGATYYSDEYAVIDLEGHVHAFPRQLRLRPDILRQQIGSLPRLHYGGPLDSLPLGWVLNIRYDPLGIWRPRALTPGQTLLALLENTVAVRRQSELTVQTLKAAVSSAAGWQAERADASSAAGDILRLLDRS